MTFETIRLILTTIKDNVDNNIYDYRFIFQQTEPLQFFKMNYDDIPDCFNCNVLSFYIDFEYKYIFIVSEVVKHDKK